MQTKKPRTTVSKKVKEELPEAVMASLGEIGEKSFNRVAMASEGEGRKNRAAVISKTQRFANLENGVVPYMYGNGNGTYAPDISLRDTIILCQKAYYNVPIYRNTIDLMTEFSLSDVYLTGGNEQSRKFYNLWLKKIDVWALQDEFYREMYRSGNIFLYSFNADMSRDSMMKIQEAFGAEGATPLSQEDSRSLPIKYILLNPADINVLASSSFMSPHYTKTLNSYEIQALLDPKTEQDKVLADKIPEIAELNKGRKGREAAVSGLKIKLEGDRLICSFYKKQGYEPLAVPMGFAVLEDINNKLELKKIDQAIARTIQQAVLLITMGGEKVGLPGQKNLQAMRSLFDSQSVGKVLVADYTTDAKFVVPDISDLLNPEKYEILDRDIRTGLNNILFGDEKYSNTSVKVKVFFARLKYGREKFLKDFLIPEMKKVGKALGFKSIPEPKLPDVDFEDNATMSRVYSQLVSLGVLTPDEAIEVFQSGRLPTPEESLESQKKLKPLRDKGYYAPLTTPTIAQQKELIKAKPPTAGPASGPSGKPSSPAGRPAGSGGEKQQVKRPQRALGSDESYSCVAMRGVMVELTKLENQIEAHLRSKFKIRKLSFEQKNVASEIAEAIAVKEEMKDWGVKMADYCDNLNATLSAQTPQEEKIDEVAMTHGLNTMAAAILYHSRINKNQLN